MFNFTQIQTLYKEKGHMLILRHYRFLFTVFSLYHFLFITLLRDHIAQLT